MSGPDAAGTSAGSRWHVAPGGELTGRLRVPGDKSVSHRSALFGAIADGVTRVDGYLAGEDTLNTLRAMVALGVRIDGLDALEAGEAEVQLAIHGAGPEGLRASGGGDPSPLDLGNSGTAMRLLPGVLCALPFASVLTGDASLRGRPMRRITAPLAQMGASVEPTAAGTPPLRIQPVAALRGIEFASPVSSAQVKSCVLLAGLFAKGETRVTEPAPSRDHTERMLAAFGADVEAGKLSAIVRPSRLRATALRVPSDLSSAAFFLVGASIASGSDLTLEGVGMNPSRTGVLDILRLMGARIDVLDERVEGGEPIADLRVRGAALRGIDVPPELVPLAIDEFPALSVAAACADGVTRVTGAKELRVKESDRIAAIVRGLRGIGADANELPDGFEVRGGSVRGGEVDSHGDHRIAMAFAMSALVADGEVRVADTENVATSFPGFAALARGAGLRLEA